MFRTLLLASGITALTAGAALAADVIEPTAYDWTGLYVGIHGGYNFGSSGGVHFDDVGGDFDPSNRDERIAAGHPDTVGDNLDGFIGGAQLGYNFQTDSLVIGLETDVSYLDLDEDEHVNVPAGGGFVEHDYFSSQSIDWLGTTRLRLGYAFDRSLIYLTGGVAYGDTEYSHETLNAGRDAGGESKFKVGWTLGGGLEYAITDAITLRGEYLYYDLGKSSSEDFYDPTFDNFSETWSAKFRGNIARAGINLRF